MQEAGSMDPATSRTSKPSLSRPEESDSEFINEKPVSLTDGERRNPPIPSDADIDIEANLMQRKSHVEKELQEEVGIKERTTTWYRTIWQTIRPGYIIDHLDYASFQIAFRTIFVLWVTIFFVDVDKTRAWLGQAPYLMQIMALITASGGRPVVLSQITAVLSIGTLLYGWTYFIVANAITTRMRGNMSETEAVEQLMAKGYCTNVTGAELKQCITNTIFSGVFLETRCTVVFIFALLIGLTSLYMFRRQSLLFIAPTIIGVITISITCAFGVHFPFFAAETLGFTVLKPSGLVFCLDLLCSATIFPYTASYAFFKGITGNMRQVKKIADEHIEFLATVRPSSVDFEKQQELRERTTGVQGKLGPLNLLATVTSFEFAYGRLDSGDAGEVRSMMKNLVSSLAGFENFYGSIHDRKLVILDDIRPLNSIRRATTVNFEKKKSRSKLFQKLHKVYKPVGLYENRRRMEFLHSSVFDGAASTDELDNLTLGDLDYLMELVNRRFSSSLMAASRLIEALVQWLDAANHYRTYSIFNRKKHEQRRVEAHEALLSAHNGLRRELDEINNTKWVELLQWRAEQGLDSSRMPHVLELVGAGALFGFSTSVYGESILRMSKVFLSLDQHVPKPRFIAPWTKTHRNRARLSRATIATSTGANTAGAEQEPNPADFAAFAPYVETQTRDPDSLPPRNIGHLIGKRFVKFYGMLLNKHLLFSIRSAILTVVAAIPIFCRPTARWYYENRLVWVMIMTGISTSEFTGDTFYAFASKIVYTFFGCVVGMVAWYISTGNGDGNHYGFAATFLVLAVYLAYYRHFSVHSTPMPSIVYTIAVCLVLGTSWVDKQTTVLSSLGAGFHVAWVRFVTVIVGLTLGFIASVFPRPQTGKHAIRMILSQTLRLIGNLHCDLGKFALKRMDDPSVHMLTRDDVLLHRIRAVLEKLVSIQPMLRSLRFEPDMTGPWPKQKYLRLIRLETDLTRLHLALYVIFNRLQDPQMWVDTMLLKFGWQSEELLAELFSVFHMASGSLALKFALPKVTVAQTTARHMEILNEATIGGQSSFLVSSRPGSPMASRANSFIEDSRLELEELFTPDGQLCLVGLMLVHMIYERVDEVMLVVKGLVGEEYDVDDRLTGMRTFFE